jgi:putative SOS response-associated peptidase YedK
VQAVVKRVIQTEKAYALGLNLVRSVGDGEGSADDDNHLWVIRQNRESGERSLDKLWWGLIPSTFEIPPERPFRAARAETVASLPAFRDSYATRRAILPVEDAFEWRATRGPNKGKRFGISMRDGSAYGVASIWDVWQNPVTQERVHTFAIVTTGANELVAQIHERMPVILAPSDYERWLGSQPDASDLLRQYSAELMAIRPFAAAGSRARDEGPSLFDLL